MESLQDLPPGPLYAFFRPVKVVRCCHLIPRSYRVSTLALDMSSVHMYHSVTSWTLPRTDHPIYLGRAFS